MVSILAAIKAIVFALVALVMLPTMVFLMPKFVRLAAGNRMHLKFIYVPKFLLLIDRPLQSWAPLRSVKGCEVVVMPVFQVAAFLQAFCRYIKCFSVFCPLPLYNFRSFMLLISMSWMLSRGFRQVAAVFGLHSLFDFSHMGLFRHGLQSSWIFV